MLKKFDGYRLFVAVGFLFETGLYFSFDHIRDKSAEEIIATGICFILFSLARKVG